MWVTKMKQISKIFATALVIYLSSARIAQARTVTTISPPTGSGLGDVSCLEVLHAVETPVPNNDDTTSPSPNFIADFPNPISCNPITFKLNSPVDSVVFVEPSSGTTEYYITQTIVNDTIDHWKGVNLKIGFGINNDFATPDVILFPTGVALPTFDNTPAPTSSKFSQINLDGSFTINWSEGSVAPGESVSLSYSLDVPDDLFGLNLYDSFTIRQTPIPAIPELTSVPEPSSLGGLIAFGCLGFWRLKRNFFHRFRGS